MSENYLTIESGWLKEYIKKQGGILNITERYVTLG